ncbi:nicotinate phosphoribosyltransferase [Rubripirellula sp.]|jgi:nicotinate phosphoribosyltransferase|nr:nicotinate phosphoribosyltransferase [Rubripirellula sp.]MDF1842988.1 nicotinate phosphoribosyltransferase [Rubripirellula sp.]
MIDSLYAPSLALLTDLYQLTMGFGYWRNRIHERRAVFHLFFRQCPFGGDYAIAAGLETALKWLHDFQVEAEDVAYLRTLCGNDGKPLFSEGFLEALAGMHLELNVDAIREGSIVFAHQPLMRIEGPLWHCQWVETALLNLINFQTLIATKAARVCAAAQGDRVLEFGLRRAQGIDGALSASRASFIGGCHATSNVMAGRIFGIPVAGTHAHSWVMSFDDEKTAFDAYASALPNNCVFLVDTYDTIQGVDHAIEIGHRLRSRGHEMIGIRLDSGDLADLSIRARQRLDQQGFPDALIVASNDLDEHEIKKLKQKHATIAVWGVGTNLVTARDQPALGGVYKLGAIQDDQNQWQPRIKLSELPIKTSTPGIQQVRRYWNDNQMVGDVVYSELLGQPDDGRVELFGDRNGVVTVSNWDRSEDLLQPVMRDGKIVTELPSLTEIQQHANSQKQAWAKASNYPIGLDPKLAEQKRDLIAACN